MKKILVLSQATLPLDRQINNNDNIIGEYKFVFDENEKYDYLVVIDDIKESFRISEDCLGCFLFTGEPPFVKLYPQPYIDQFNFIFTCQKQLLKRENSYLSIPPLPWMTGCKLANNSHNMMKGSYLTYQELFDYNNENRLDKICLITSNKKITKGHKNRVHFAEKIKKMFPDQIDILGNGFENISDKFEIQSKYKYSLVIENCVYPNYWTEKLADTYLAGSFPIYYGASNILEYFSKDQLAVINILDIKKTVSTIKMIMENNIYEKSKKKLVYAKSEILEKYNMFRVIVDALNYIEQNGKKYTINKNRIINPIEYRLLDKIKQFYIRTTY